MFVRASFAGQYRHYRRTFCVRYLSAIWQGEATETASCIEDRSTRPRRVCGTISRRLTAVGKQGWWLHMAVRHWRGTAV